MLRVVVVGDSAIWGQGLAQDEKYVFKYVKWLNDQGIEASLSRKDFSAHSGAIIGNKTELNASELLTENEVNSATYFRRFYPEVPTSYPTILRQLENISDPDNVDLLIMNGGVNDIGITNVATFNDDDFDDLLQTVQKVSQNMLPGLFKRVNSLLPKTKIIYTGYYPALSNKSILPPEYIPSIIGLLWALEGDDLQKQAMQFNELFLSEISFQIAQFNSNHEQQVVFTPSGFGAENAAYASDNLVFELGEKTDEAVNEGRAHYCELTKNKNTGSDNGEVIIGGGRSNNDSLLDWIKKNIDQAQCSLAYVAHPNRAGADKYVEQLQKFSKHVMRPCSVREIFESISTTSLSYKESLAKFATPKINSLRQLASMQWINVISISLNVKFSVFLTTPKDPFPQELDFDFGWGKVSINMSYHSGSSAFAATRIGAFDARGDIQMNRLTQVRMFLKLADFFKFKIDLRVFVNGYEIINKKLSENSFSRSGESIMLHQWQVS